MGVLSVASGKSLWRGYEYYLEKKVLSYKQISESVYEGTVSGSNGIIYHVHLDLEHPRKTTTCDCPLAKGKKIVCKHTVALFFIEPYAEKASLHVRDAFLIRIMTLQRAKQKPPPGPNLVGVFACSSRLLSLLWLSIHKAQTEVLLYVDIIAAQRR